MHKIIYQIIVVFNNLLPLSSFFNPLLRASHNGEYSYLTFSTPPGLYPKFYQSNINTYPVLSMIMQKF